MRPNYILVIFARYPIEQPTSQKPDGTSGVSRCLFRARFPAWTDIGCFPLLYAALYRPDRIEGCDAHACKVRCLDDRNVIFSPRYVQRDEPTIEAFKGRSQRPSFSLQCQRSIKPKKMRNNHTLVMFTLACLTLSGDAHDIAYTDCAVSPRWVASRVTSC